jgi:hypothetical protein
LMKNKMMQSSLGFKHLTQASTSASENAQRAGSTHSTAADV